MQLLEAQTTWVEVDGVMRHATPLPQVPSMPQLYTPKEALLLQLRSTKRRLGKAPKLVAAYIAEVQKLDNACYVVKLDPGAEETTSSWYIPHHMLQHNRKYRVIFNCLFQFKDESLNELLLPRPLLASLFSILL